MRRLAGLILLVLFASLASAQDDGIPNNCTFARGVFYNRNWFIRAEVSGTSVVDWSSGETVRILGQRAGADMIVGRWSPECQYAAVSYGAPDDNGMLIYTTVVYDVVNGGEAAVLDGARRIPYPITWDTNSTRLLVETRFGAYIHYLGGGDVWLTSEADGNSRAFRPGTVRWDYAANQLIGVLTIYPFGSAAYDMSSGALVGLTDQFSRPQDIAMATTQVQGRENGEKYRCLSAGQDSIDSWTYQGVTRFYRGTTRAGIENAHPVYQADQKRIVLVENSTNDILRVLVDDVDYTFTRHSSIAWRDNCTRLYVSFYPLAVTFDLVNGTREVAQPPPVRTDFGCNYSVEYHATNKNVAAVSFADRSQPNILDSGIDVQEFEYLSKSPDCRFVAVDMMQNNVTDTVIYDLATQQRIVVVPDAVGAHRLVEWSPNSTHAFIHTKDGGVIANLSTGAQILLDGGAALSREAIDRPGYRNWTTGYTTTRNFTQVEWDTARGLMFGVPVDARNHVLAIDLISGTVAGDYTIDGVTAQVNYIRHNSTIVVYTHHLAPVLAPGKYGIAVWYIGGVSVQLATARPVAANASSTARYYARIGSPQFSPDGRYMLMRGRHNTLLIWDLANLSGAAPHLPNYIHTVANTRAAKFIDNTTIEAIYVTMDARGKQTYRTYHYDVVTGALLSEDAEVSQWDYWTYILIPN